MTACCRKAFQSGSKGSSLVSFLICGCSGSSCCGGLSVSSMWLLPSAGCVPVASSVVCVAIVLRGVGGCGGGGIVCVVASLCSVCVCGARVGAILTGGRRAIVRDRVLN
eukprot:7159094-Prorocentrum_lima.AAC.1